MKAHSPKQAKPARNRKRSQRAPRWLTFSAVGISVCATAGGAMAPQTFAGPHTRNWTINLLTQSATSFHFDIESGTVAEAIASFEKVTGLRLTLSREGVGALPSPGVKGDYTADRALRVLLAGTSLGFRYTSATALMLELQNQSTVAVVDTVPDTPSSTKYTEPLREIPQTIAVIPSAVMEQQGAVSLTDTLRNVPGITMQAGENGGASTTTGDMFNMRGFNASNSLMVDGVRDDGLISRNIYNIEQVEVFMGPTGSDIGRGTASGYVNMATKTPNMQSSYSANVAYDTANQKRTTFDFNRTLKLGPAGSWLSRAAARLNGLWQQGGVPGRDVVTMRNRSIAPGLALGLGTSTRATFTSEFTRERNTPDYGIPAAAWLDEPLTPTIVRANQEVDQANYYGSRDYDFDHTSQGNVTARVEHDMTGNVSVRYQTRYNETHRVAVVSGIGAFTPATQTVAISRQGSDRKNRIVSNQANAVAHFFTGLFKHSLTSGSEYTYEDQLAPTLGGFGTRAAVNIYNPNTDDPITGYAPAPTGALSKGWTNTIALYAFDTVGIGKRLQFNGGLRWEHYQTNFRTLSADVLTVDQRAADGMLSGKTGVLYRITNGGNVYFSYGTTVTPPGTANFTLSAQANNQNNPNVKPQESRNIEIGSKWDFFGSRLSVTGSAFDTRNRNVIFTVDATSVPPLFNQDDEQRVKGVSLGITGRPINRLQLLANFGALDSRSHSQNAANNGKRLTLTPPYSGRIWATYQLPHRINVGGGVQYIEKVWVNAANTIKAPGYVIADALVEYPVNDHVMVRLNVNNVTNETYIRSVNNAGNRYNPGRPISAMLSTNFKF